MNTKETPAMTAQELLESLRQRIADGDTTVTAAELQQAESGVEFARLQTAGQQKRDAASAHQARLDELEKIRDEVEIGLPNISEKLRAKLEKIDKEIADAMTIAVDHDRKITSYGAKINELAKQGATIDDLEYTANGIVAGERVVGEIGLNAIVVRAARKKADFSGTKLSLADGYKPADKRHADNGVAVKLRRSLGGFDEGEVIKVTPSIAERMIEQGHVEITG